MAEKECGIQGDDNPHREVGGVKYVVVKFRLAEQSAFSAPEAQNGFCDAEDDYETEDKGGSVVFHALSLAWMGLSAKNFIPETS